MNPQSDLTTLGQVWDQVESMSAHCFDQMIPVKDIHFNGLETVNIGSEPYPLRDMAQRSIAFRLGIPIQYLRKCPEDIQAFNLNHWITKEKNDELFFRFDSAEVRAIFTPRYTPVDNFEVLERLDSLGYGPDSVVQCKIDEGVMLLNIPDSKAEFAVDARGKDRMFPGVSIGNSEIGLRSLSISAFVLRLVCTNGLITNEETSSSYRHISSRILEEFPDVLARVTANLGLQRERFMISLESKVDDPQATMRSFNRQFQLDKDQQAALEWAWPQEEGETMFNVVNAYTKAAQYPGLTADSAYRLQEVGGRILALVN